MQIDAQRGVEEVWKISIIEEVIAEFIEGVVGQRCSRRACKYPSPSIVVVTDNTQHDLLLASVLRVVTIGNML